MSCHTLTPITSPNRGLVVLQCYVVWSGGGMVLMGSFFNTMVVVRIFSPYVTGVMWWMYAVGIETVVL